MKQKLAILAVVVAVAAIGCWRVLAGVNPNILSVKVVTGDVAVGGKKLVECTGSLDPAAPNPKVRVSWTQSGSKFVLTDTSGTPVTPDDYNGPNTPYKDYTVPASFKLEFYTVGVAPSGIDDQAITIEALHNTPPLDNTAKFTVVKVDKIEYQRFDLSTWVTDLKIAAGAKNTDVHKAKVRITIVPAKAGVSVTAAKNGGNGKLIPGVLSPTTAQSTGPSGQVVWDYITSDKLGDLTVKVVDLANCPVSVDLGSTMHEVWDCDGAYDFRFPVEFWPELSDPVYFYPTLNVIAGNGAVVQHSMGFYTPDLTIIETVYDFWNGTITDKLIPASYPAYIGLPAGYTVDDFVEHSPTTEISPGVYRNYQTTHDQYLFDPVAFTLTTWEVDSYEFNPYDTNVYYQ